MIEITFLCFVILAFVRLDIASNVRFKALHVINEKRTAEIDAGMTPVDGEYESYGFDFEFRNAFDVSFVRQMLDLRKWRFKDFYPALAEAK